jgi:hypothetical protein
MMLQEAACCGSENFKLFSDKHAHSDTGEQMHHSCRQGRKGGGDPRGQEPSTPTMKAARVMHADGVEMHAHGRERRLGVSRDTVCLFGGGETTRAARGAQSLSQGQHHARCIYLAPFFAAVLAGLAIALAGLALAAGLAAALAAGLATFAALGAATLALDAGFLAAVFFCAEQRCVRGARRQRGCEKSTRVSLACAVRARDGSRRSPRPSAPSSAKPSSSARRPS